MVDDGGAGDFSDSIGGDGGSNSGGIGSGGDSSSIGGDSGDFFRQIRGAGSNASNFVSCNFYIGCAHHVCQVFGVW